MELKKKKLSHINWRKIREEKDKILNDRLEILQSLIDHGAYTPMSSLNPHVLFSASTNKFKEPNSFRPGFKRYGGGR